MARISLSQLTSSLLVPPSPLKLTPAPLLLSVPNVKSRPQRPATRRLKLHLYHLQLVFLAASPQMSHRRLGYSHNTSSSRTKQP